MAAVVKLKATRALVIDVDFCYTHGNFLSFHQSAGTILATIWTAKLCLGTLISPGVLRGVCLESALEELLELQDGVPSLIYPFRLTALN